MLKCVEGLIRVWFLVNTSLRFKASVNALSPWCYAEIDYSAVNEYSKAHYGFQCFENERLIEPVYNARDGVLPVNRPNKLEDPCMANCGFMLQGDENSSIASVNWADLDSIRKRYLPQLRDMIRHAYPTESISHILFWNPVVRSKGATQTRVGDGKTTPTASYAGLPHLDLDVNAFTSAEEMIDLLMKNRIDDLTLKPSAQCQELIDCVERGQRFSIVNAWKNIGTTPVFNEPLALLATRYDDMLKPFPYSNPKMRTFNEKSLNQDGPQPDLMKNLHDISLWYTFPSILSSEILFFSQYDRKSSEPSDLWHCSITPIGQSSEWSNPRRSFDLRCFVVFSEVVEVKLDRFHADRPKSFLSLKASSNFCSDQSKKRT